MKAWRCCAVVCRLLVAPQRKLPAACRLTTCSPLCCPADTCGVSLSCCCAGVQPAEGVGHGHGSGPQGGPRSSSSSSSSSLHAAVPAPGGVLACCRPCAGPGACHVDQPQPPPLRSHCTALLPCPAITPSGQAIKRLFVKPGLWPQSHITALPPRHWHPACPRS